LLQRALPIFAIVALVSCAATSPGDTAAGSADAAKPPAARVNPPPQEPAPIVLKVVTFNVQDLPVEGENRPARMKALGEVLTELDVDIVGFQESFLPDDRKILIEALSGSRLKHRKYYPSGKVGSGLLIASAYPIRGADFCRYKASNRWYDQGGDWWAGKGAAKAEIELPPPYGILDFYDTHAQADYGKPENVAIRKRQMKELADYINRSHDRSRPGILVGDINCRVDTGEHKTLVSGARLVRLLNIYSRVDHVFALPSSGFKIEMVDCLEIEKHNGIRLSNHNGYMVRVRISRIAVGGSSGVEDR